MIVEDEQEYQCYKRERIKWYDPSTSGPQYIKTVQMVFPDWEKYEEKFLNERIGKK